MGLARLGKRRSRFRGVTFILFNRSEMILRQTPKWADVRVPVQAEVAARAVVGSVMLLQAAELFGSDSRDLRFVGE